MLMRTVFQKKYGFRAANTGVRGGGGRVNHRTAISSFCHYKGRIRTREYWMIYRGPGFLAGVWFRSSPTPSPPLPSVSSTGDPEEDWEREKTCWRERSEEWGRSQIIRRRENLVFYESFNTLWSVPITNNKGSWFPNLKLRDRTVSGSLLLGTDFTPDRPVVDQNPKNLL